MSAVKVVPPVAREDPIGLITDPHRAAVRGGTPRHAEHERPGSTGRRQATKGKQIIKRRNRQKKKKLYWRRVWCDGCVPSVCFTALYIGRYPLICSWKWYSWLLLWRSLHFFNIL